MRKLAWILSFYILSRIALIVQVINQPGDTSTSPDRPKDRPWSSATLQDDCNKQLPPEVCETFEDAYLRQCDGENDLALEKYRQMINCLEDTEIYILLKSSPTFLHNWELVHSSLGLACPSL